MTTRTGMTRDELTQRLIGLGFQQCNRSGTLSMTRPDGFVIYVGADDDHDGMVGLGVFDPDGNCEWDQSPLFPVVAFYAVVGTIHCG